MADPKISTLNSGTQLAAPAQNDVLPITDVSDTTEATTGTTKPIVLSNLLLSPYGRILYQGAPAAKTVAVTLTIAELLGYIITGIHAAGVTQAYTLPTGTLCDAGATFVTESAFDWVLINTSLAAIDTITLTGGADHTIVGNPIVQSAHSTTGGIYGNSATFRTRRTAANTFVTYRIA